MMEIIRRWDRGPGTKGTCTRVNLSALLPGLQQALRCLYPRSFLSFYFFSYLSIFLTQAKGHFNVLRTSKRQNKIHHPPNLSRQIFFLFFSFFLDTSKVHHFFQVFHFVSPFLSPWLVHQYLTDPKDILLEHLKYSSGNFFLIIEK